MKTPKPKPRSPSPTSVSRLSYERSYHRGCEGELLVEVKTVYTERRGLRVSAVTDVVLKTGNGSWSLVHDVHGVLHLQHHDKLDKGVKR